MDEIDYNKGEKKGSLMRDEKLALHRKYRPKDFNEFIGSESSIESLKTILDREKGLPHTFLFQGPSGCGKTTLARIVAKYLGASSEDSIVEYNISKTRGIDAAKEIISSTMYKSMGGGPKIFVLNEVHKATNEFQNAMLEILEEPPEHVFFILVTTDPDKLLKTVRTRCCTFQVSLLQRSKIIKLLEWVCSPENEDVEISNRVLRKIAESCDGSPRKALVFLDQIIDIADDEIALQTIVDSTFDEATISDLCNALIRPGTRWETLASIIKKMDEDPETIRYSVLTWMSKILLGKSSDRISQIIELFSPSWIYIGKAGLINTCYLVTKI